MIYVVWFTFVFVALLIDRQGKRPVGFIRMLLPLIFILLIGLRAPSVGVDTSSYYEHYYTFGQDGCPFVEVGFDWLNRFCYHNDLGISTFLIVCSLIAVAPVSIVLCKLPTKEYSIAAAMFFSMAFITLCNGVRQSMATGIFFFSTFYLIREGQSKTKSLVYVSGILIASLFHITALLLIVFLFIWKIKINKSLALLIYVLSFFFVFLDLSSIIPDLPLTKIGNRDFSRYEEMSYIGGASIVGFVVSTIPNVIILWKMFETKAVDKYPLVCLFVYLSFVIKNLAFGMPIVGRWTMYFVWFIYVLIAKMYYEDKNRASKLHWGILFVVYIILTLNSYASSQNQVSPYQFVWESVID